MNNGIGAVVSFLILILGLIIIVLILALQEPDYWKDRYVQKHCVAWESTGNATKKCACLDDEPCAKTEEVKQ